MYLYLCFYDHFWLFVDINQVIINQDLLYGKFSFSVLSLEGMEVIAGRGGNFGKVNSVLRVKLYKTNDFNQSNFVNIAYTYSISYNKYKDKEVHFYL